MIRRTLPLVLAASVALSGCISLFPKSKPVTLYRLNPTVSAPANAAASGPKVTVLRAPIYFTRVAAGDTIVTVNGSEAASIAHTRWATPVQLMFEEALTAAFDGDARVNLITRGSPAPPELTLRVEVIQFEANYTNGEGAAPTIMTAARLSYAAPKSSETYETVVKAQAVAADNRVGPIVDAYNVATGELLTKIVAETDRLAASAGAFTAVRSGASRP